MANRTQKPAEVADAVEEHDRLAADRRSEKEVLLFHQRSQHQ
jgi:hypothetical protein